MSSSVHACGFGDGRWITARTNPGRFCSNQRPSGVAITTMYQKRQMLRASRTSVFAHRCGMLSATYFSKRSGARTQRMNAIHPPQSCASSFTRSSPIVSIRLSTSVAMFSLS